jgi:hypothetical protein
MSHTAIADCFTGGMASGEIGVCQGIRVLGQELLAVEVPWQALGGGSARGEWRNCCAGAAVGPPKRGGTGANRVEVQGERNEREEAGGGGRSRAQGMHSCAA